MTRSLERALRHLLELPSFQEMPMEWAVFATAAPQEALDRAWREAWNWMLLYSLLRSVYGDGDRRVARAAAARQAADDAELPWTEYMRRARDGIRAVVPPPRLAELEPLEDVTHEL